MRTFLAPSFFLKFCLSAGCCFQKSLYFARRDALCELQRRLGSTKSLPKFAAPRSFLHTGLMENLWILSGSHFLSVAATFPEELVGTWIICVVRVRFRTMFLVVWFTSISCCAQGNNKTNWISTFLFFEVAERNGIVAVPTREAHFRS